MVTKPKRSWPLFLVASLAFVPVFGFFIGAIAIIWALVSNRPRALWAAALAGAGAMLNIATLVAIGAWVQTKPAYADVAAEGAQVSMLRVVGQLEEYHRKEGSYPQSLQVFRTLPWSLHLVSTRDVSVPLIKGFRDYQYHVASDGRTYTLFALGQDGRAGTADDIYPTLPDSLIAGSGYRPPSAQHHN